MKKNSALNKEIKNMYGNTLIIGDIEEKLVKTLENNKKIKICNILGNKEYDSDGESSKTKKFRLTKLRKFKKKKVNFLICDYNKIDNYLKTFIKDSIYITNDYIYFCTNKPSKIRKKYQRYNVEIKEINCVESTILIINTSRAKNNKIKEFIYNIIDFFENIIDIITEMLVS